MRYWCKIKYREKLRGIDLYNHLGLLITDLIIWSNLLYNPDNGDMISEGVFLFNVVFIFYRYFI